MGARTRSANRRRLMPRYCHRGWFVLPILVGIALWLRWPTFAHPIWNVDEAIHAAVARTLLDGGVLYRDAIDQRTPLTYYATAAVFKIFGANNLAAMRIFVALLVGGTGFLLLCAGRSLRRPAAGGAAAVAYVLLATGAFFQGDANAINTEWFLAFFTAAAAAAFLARGGGGEPWRQVGIGALLGAAFLSKQPALLDLAAPAAALVYIAWRTRRVAAGTRTLAALLAGWLLPVAIAAVWLAARGAWRDAEFYTWIYNLRYYAPETTTADRISSALLAVRLMGTAAPALLAVWLIGGAATTVRLLQRPVSIEGAAADTGRLYVVVWSLTSLAGAAASGRDFQHYSIQFLPSFCLGAALAGTGAVRWLWQLRTGRPTARAVAVVLVLAFAAPPVVHALAHRHRTLPDDASTRVSLYIRHHSPADARIFVWGYQPDIYLLSNRRPASRFVYASFLTGLIPWTNVAPGRDTHYAIVPGAMADLLADLARTPPLYIVDCSAGPNRHWDKYPPADFPPFAAYLRAHYRQEAPEQFVPQGFRLYRRMTDAEVAAAQQVAATQLPPAAAAKLPLAVLAAGIDPASASAPYGTDRTVTDGHVEYFMHAPSQLTYRLPPGGAAVRGGFGIRPAAYAAENKGPTDGAEFVVRWTPDGGTPRVLFRQLLRPLTVAADRGTHAFDVDLPADEHGGTLEFAISPGPADNNASDWTYWSDLTLEKYH